MKRRVITSTIHIVAFLALVAGTALAAAAVPKQFSGTVSDYTPLISANNPTGPWEMRGDWSLDLKNHSREADFSAFMTMELSDYWISSTDADAANPTIRSAHTHHIVMTDATVSFDASDTSGCPANSPANTPRFVVNGTANFISGNGNPAPFEKNGPSMLQICISGGTDGQSEVEYSNITLTFTGPATGHFGPQAIHGVVSLEVK